MRRILALAPAAVTAVALFPILPGPLRATALTAGFLLAPGALLWWSLGGPLSRNVVALPAIAFAFSLALLLPATVALLFFRASGWGIAWPVVGLLILLGWRASSSPIPTVERPPAWWWVLPVLAISIAAIFRATDFDQLTHISVVNFIKANGHYPEMNPFVIGDLPLAPRWRVNGWTGLQGILAHLSDVGGLPLLTKLLAPLFVLIAASATFLFASHLGDERFACIAALVAAVVLPILWVVPEPVAQTRLWLSSASQDKSVGFIVLLPIAMVVLLQLFERPEWRRGTGAAALLLALFFVHPLMFVFAVLLAGSYLAVDALGSRSVPLRPALWLAAAAFPAALTGLLVGQPGPAFGINLDRVEVSDVAVERRFGPVTVWEPFKVVGQNPPNAPDAETFFALKRLGYLGQVPARYMIVGGVVMPSLRLLLIGVHLAVLVACLFVCIRAPSGPLRRWIIASTTLAVLPFLVPPAAAVFGKIATPWVLWRFIWLLPLPFAAAWLLDRALRRSLWEGVALAALVAMLATTFIPDPWVRPSFRREPLSNRLTDKSGNLMVERDFSPWTALQGGELRAVLGPTIRGPNNFPSDRLEEARRRELDVRRFYGTRASFEERMAILDRYDVDLVLAKTWHAERFEAQGIPLTDLEILPLSFVLFRVTPSQGAERLKSLGYVE